MFGYVKPHNAELLVKEYELYRAVYCGVCRAMRKYTGMLSSLGLSYDIVFLAVTRSVLCGDEISTHRASCIVHPLKKRNIADENPSVAYAAGVSAILAYHKLRDDMRDEGLWTKIKTLFPLAVMKRARKKARLPDLDKKISAHMKALCAEERKRNGSLDMCADIFGDLLAEAFAYGLTGEHYSTAYEMGKRLGRFIYITDAADDYEKDIKKNRYNPYAIIYGKEGLSEQARDEIKLSLRLELEALAAVTEGLPYNGRAPEENIIKNTVYLGLPRVIPFERCMNEKSL